MATVRRLRPQTHTTMAEHLRLVLELPLPLSPQARSEITDALSAFSPECWTYVMIGREASRIILQRIVAGARPGVTLAVWEAARCDLQR